MNILGKNNTRINFKKSDSQNKEFAFMKAHELNNIEKLIKHSDGTYSKTVWRVGKNTSRQLIVETDNSSKENLALIINHLNKLFGYKFNAIKTLHGFHIIGEHLYPNIIDQQTHKEKASIDWYKANTKVLNNSISGTLESFEYGNKILEMDKELRQYQDCGNYKELFTASLKNSGLLNCIGDIDILYTILSIKYGKSTLRISKKQPHDKYEEVKYG